jgi:hypothetical protein
MVWHYEADYDGMVWHYELNTKLWYDITMLNTIIWYDITRLNTMLWSDSTRLNTMLWSDITRLNTMLWIVMSGHNIVFSLVMSDHSIVFRYVMSYHSNVFSFLLSDHNNVISLVMRCLQWCHSMVWRYEVFTDSSLHKIKGHVRLRVAIVYISHLTHFSRNTILYSFVLINNHKSRIRQGTQINHWTTALKERIINQKSQVSHHYLVKTIAIRLITPQMLFVSDDTR